MADVAVNTLIVFYSRYGASEQLALAAGVGALQARASIRLRRLADDVDPGIIAADAAWSQNLGRMRRDYVTPRPADSAWADVIVLVTPNDSPHQLQGYLASLRAEGEMAGKLAAPLSSDLADATLASIHAAAAAARFIVVPEPAGASGTDAARTQGRHVSEMARALKTLG